MSQRPFVSACLPGQVRAAGETKTPGPACCGCSPLQLPGSGATLKLYAPAAPDDRASRPDHQPAHAMPHDLARSRKETADGKERSCRLWHNCSVQVAAGASRSACRRAAGALRSSVSGRRSARLRRRALAPAGGCTVAATLVFSRCRRRPGSGWGKTELQPESAQGREEPQCGRAGSGGDERDGGGGREHQECLGRLGDHHDRQAGRQQQEDCRP